jgi:hypothetical protein
LIAGVAIFTAVMFTLVQSLSERFGPQVEADLEWRALRGAQELSYKADLGLAVGDPAIVREAFGVYAESHDVQAIVAVDTHGKLIAQHGTLPSIALVFATRPRTLAHGAGYVASWAPSSIEGTDRASFPAGGGLVRARNGEPARRDSSLRRLPRPTTEASR